METKTLVKIRHLILFSSFLLPVIFASSILAVGKPDSTGRPEGVGRTRIRLTEAKLKACQAKENGIKKRTLQLTKLATTMQEKFDAIAGRVEEYYASKIVPSGKTVANFTNLVADIQTKKGTVRTALTTAQNNAEGFTCDGNDPKGQLTQFRDNMRAVKSSLKNYRTSIKNLIVAVL